MLSLAARAFSEVPGEEDDNGMQVIAGQPAYPMVRMVRANIAENLRAGRHALTELLGKGGQRGFGYAESAQAVPREGHRDPAALGIDGRAKHGFRWNAPLSRIAASHARPPAGPPGNDRNS